MKVRHKESGTEVEAFKHDGSDDSAVKIAHWVSNRGGQADILHKGTVDFDLHAAFIRLYRDGETEIVRPNCWVLEARQGRFYTIFPDDFNELYEAIK